MHVCVCVASIVIEIVRGDTIHAHVPSVTPYMPPYSHAHTNSPRLHKTCILAIYIFLGGWLGGVPPETQDAAIFICCTYLLRDVGFDRDIGLDADIVWLGHRHSRCGTRKTYSLPHVHSDTLSFQPTHALPHALPQTLLLSPFQCLQTLKKARTISSCFYLPLRLIKAVLGLK